MTKNKSSSLIKRFAIELGKGKKKSEPRKSKTRGKAEGARNIDTQFLIKSILSNETTISPKPPGNSQNKGSANRSLKKRKNSNVTTNFNLTGIFSKKKRGKINLTKNARSKDKLYKNIDMQFFNKKKSTSKSRDKSAKSSHNYKGKV